MNDIQETSNRIRDDDVKIHWRESIKERPGGGERVRLDFLQACRGKANNGLSLGKESEFIAYLEKTLDHLTVPIEDPKNTSDERNSSERKGHASSVFGSYNSRLFKEFQKK